MPRFASGIFELQATCVSCTSFIFAQHIPRKVKLSASPFPPARGRERAPAELAVRVSKIARALSGAGAWDRVRQVSAVLHNRGAGQITKQPVQSPCVSLKGVRVVVLSKAP